MSLHLVVLDKDAGSWVHRRLDMMAGVSREKRHISSKSKKSGWKPWRPPSKRDIAWPRWTGFRGKTVWDWLQLLIVPLVLALVGVVFTVQQDARQQQIQDQNAQDATLQTYLEQMNQLMLEKDLRDSDVNSEVRTLARAQTLTVLEQLDPEHRSQVLRFLMEAQLVQGEKEMDISHPRDTDPIISLRQANLEGVDVVGARLEAADLQMANLSNTRLIGASFQGANMVNVNMSEADVSGGAAGAHAGAFFYDADLTDADLSYANLSNASGLKANHLERADLSYANLTDASGLKAERLVQEHVFLKGTIMPDGTRHP
jgi:uncharacterized protein YjbI with pentapeptide repeats